MILTRAPLRVPLGGGGTDFPSYYRGHSGYILATAIDKYVHVVLHDTVDNKVRLKYSKTECVSDVEELKNRVAAETLKYYGVTKGVEIATFSDVPESSGLGGSSSFCVALVAALRCKLDLPLDKRIIFNHAYEIERIRAGQPGGLQDQFFASHGGSWSLELLPDTITKSPIDLSGLLPNLKLVYTNTSRMDLRIAATQTEESLKGDTNMIYNLDGIKELGRAIEEAIRNSDYKAVGGLFHKHWMLKKSRDVSISNSEADKLYDLARDCGALGGKLVGLGGGGFFLFLAPVFTNNGTFQCIDFGIDAEGVKVVYTS